MDDRDCRKPCEPLGLKCRALIVGLQRQLCRHRGRKNAFRNTTSRRTQHVWTHTKGLERLDRRRLSCRPMWQQQPEHNDERLQELGCCLLHKVASFATGHNSIAMGSWRRRELPEMSERYQKSVRC